MLEFRGQRISQSLAAHAVGYPVRVRRGDECDVEQAPFEGAAPLREIRNRQRPQGIAVPGTLARDEATLALQAAGREMLKRDLQRRFDGFRSAAAIDDVLETAAAQTQNCLGQAFERGARE